MSVLFYDSLGVVKMKEFKCQLYQTHKQ